MTSAPAQAPAPATPSSSSRSSTSPSPKSSPKSLISTATSPTTPASPSSAPSLPKHKRSHHRALLARLPLPGQSPWHIDHRRPRAQLGEGQVLVETTYVALNPFDWQGVAFKYGIGEEAKVMGKDGAGVVVGVGEGVTRFKLGDRVWFCANASSSHAGAFQEYSVHSASEIGRTPDHITDQQAATLGTGLITAGVALFRTLNIPLEQLVSPRPAVRSSSTEEGRKDDADAPWILIWGGAGITGVYLIALARLLGFRVICSASPANHEYVRSLGANVVLDRFSDPDELVKAIRKETGDNVRTAIDNVGKETAALCHRVLQGSASWRRTNHLPKADADSENDSQGSPGRLVPLAGSPRDEPDTSDSVRKVDSLRISFSTTFYDHPEFSVPLLDQYAELLSADHLKPARIRLVNGGLGGIENGLEDLRHGRVPGGYKLVARLADTLEVEVDQVAQAGSGSKRTRDESDATVELEQPTKRVKEEAPRLSDSGSGSGSKAPKAATYREDSGPATPFEPVGPRADKRVEERVARAAITV